MKQVVVDWFGRLFPRIATGVVAMCVVGCGQPSATEVDVLVQESVGPANIVWIVVDQLADGGDVDYETVLREGVRVPTEPAQGTSASVHSALLTGLHPAIFSGGDSHMAASLPVGVTTLPEQLRRADYYTSRSGPALHNLSLDSFESGRVYQAAEEYQTGLLGAWDVAGSDVDWQGRDFDWDLPCTVAFGCDRSVSSGPRPFFSVFNMRALDEAALSRTVTDILTALETDGSVDNTAVFLMVLGEETLDLVVRWPKWLQAFDAAVMARDVNVVDLAPTVLALAEVAVPPYMDGQPVGDSLMSAYSKQSSKELGILPKVAPSTWPDARPPTAAVPEAYPQGGLFHVAPRVELSCATEGATIIYTTERMDPFYWRLYKGPFRMRFWTLRAKCGRLGYLDSNVSTYDFDIE